MKAYMAALLLATSAAFASEVQWTRFRGKVKSVNYRTQEITLQNAEGDLIGVKVTEDVAIFDGKEIRKLSDVAVDEKVSLLFAPKPLPPKEPDEPAPGGTYPLIHR